MITINFRTAKKIMRLAQKPLIGKVFKFKKIIPTNKVVFEQDYWSDAHYSDTFYFLTLYFLGFKFINLKYYVKHMDIFFNRSHDFVTKNLLEMANNGIIDPINEKSYVMESGANSGGILNELNKTYGCKCLGIDISKKAIITGQGFFSENKKVNLEIVDVLNYDYFSKYEDKEFTHIFTSSHLIHVPNGERKSKYIEELKRISKNLVFFEKISSDNETQGKKDFLEDYSSKYKMKLYKTLEKNVGNLSPSIPLGTIRMSGIFYFNNN